MYSGLTRDTIRFARTKGRRKKLFGSYGSLSMCFVVVIDVMVIYHVQPPPSTGEGQTFTLTKDRLVEALDLGHNSPAEPITCFGPFMREI